MAYYYHYDSATGVLTDYVTEEKPGVSEEWFTTSSALTGNLTTDYKVIDGNLYKLTQVITSGIGSGIGSNIGLDWQYAIVFDADTEKIISVARDGDGIPLTGYILTTVDPVDVTNTYIHLDNREANLPISGEINGVTYTIAGTIEGSLDQLPDTGSEGDVYRRYDEMTDDYDYFVWNGHIFQYRRYDRVTYTLRRLIDDARMLSNADMDDEDDGTEAATIDTARDEALENATEDEAGTDKIVRLTLAASNWAVRTGATVVDPEDVGTITIDDDEKTMVYTIANSFIRQNTIFQVLGITRGMLRGDINWSTEEGFITFETPYGLEPYGDVVIDGVLHSTTDVYNAQGKIEAWPQGEWRFAQYSQQLQSPGWYLTIPAGGTRLIETNLDFSLARLLQLSCIWGGNTHAVMTQYYVNQSNHLLYFRLANIGSQNIRISDILLDIAYHGQLTNLVASPTQLTAEGATDTYITDSDIDEVT